MIIIIMNERDFPDARDFAADISDLEKILKDKIALENRGEKPKYANKSRMPRMDDEVRMRIPKSCLLDLYEHPPLPIVKHLAARALNKCEEASNLNRRCGEGNLSDYYPYSKIRVFIFDYHVVEILGATISIGIALGLGYMFHQYLKK